jgi:hypothetical protein
MDLIGMSENNTSETSMNETSMSEMQYECDHAIVTREISVSIRVRSVWARLLQGCDYCERDLYNEISMSEISLREISESEISKC